MPMCPRCKLSAQAGTHHGEGVCSQRLDKAEAAALAGVKPDTWARMCADSPPGGSRRADGTLVRTARRQGPAPDWPQERGPDGRLRSLWRPETVEAWLSSRPGRGARSDLADLGYGNRSAT